MKKQKDSKAVHGYQPSWDLQREKQEECAREFYDEMSEEEVRRYLEDDEC